MSIPLRQHAIRGLSPDDEKHFTDRIRRALALDIVLEDQVYHARLEKQARLNLIQSTLENLSRKERKGLWAMKVRTGKDDVGALEPYLLSRCTKIIQETGEALEGFDGRFLSGESIRLFAALHDAVVSVYPVFERLWSNPEALTSTIMNTIISSAEGVRTELSQFMSQREMQNIYLEKRDKKQIRDMVIARVGEYIEQLDTEKIAAVEKSLRPLYYLRPLVFFPFHELFSLYGVYGSPRDSGYTAHRIDLIDHIEYFERLYAALYLARKLETDDRLHPSILEKAAETAEGNLSHDVERLQSAVLWLADCAREFSEMLPLADIIRVAQRDCFYRIQMYLPRLDLNECYSAYLMRHVLGDLDKRFGDIRMGVIGYFIRELFGDTMSELEHYGSSENSEETRLGLPVFKYKLAMRAVITFMHKQYRQVLLEEIRILTRIMPARMRDEQEALIHHSSSFEDVVERIMSIDRGMAVEESDGQTLARIRSNIDRDPAQQNAYRGFVGQKHRAVLALLQKSLEHISGMISVFRLVVDLDSSTMEDSYFSFERSTELRGLLRLTLKNDIRTLEHLKGLVTEAIVLDDGF